MSKPPRKGSFEELIMHTRPGRGRTQLQDVLDSVPRNDPTARQLGVEAVGSIAEAEEQAIPWLRRCRRALRFSRR